MTTPKPELIYTPQKHIPVGEPVRTEAGNLALKFKFKDRTEVVTLESLFSMVHKANEKTQ